jgi:hypothetical protein
LSVLHETHVVLAFVEHTLSLINAARAQLDEQALASAEAAGHNMTYDKAVSFALSL